MKEYKEYIEPAISIVELETEQALLATSPTKFGLTWEEAIADEESW